MFVLLLEQVLKLHETLLTDRWGGNRWA